MVVIGEQRKERAVVNSAKTSTMANSAKREQWMYALGTIRVGNTQPSAEHKVNAQSQRTINMPLVVLNAPHTQKQHTHRRNTNTNAINKP